MTYLMWKSEVGFRIGTSRTYTNGRAQTLAGPAVRLNGEHAMLLVCFTRAEARHFTLGGPTTRSSRARVRRRLTVCLCEDLREWKAAPIASASFGYDERTGRQAILEGLGLSLRLGVQRGLDGLGGSRLASAGSRVDQRHRRSHCRCARRISIRYTARIASSEGALGKERNSLPFMPASAVRPGMVMFTEDGGFDVVEAVEEVDLDSTVYDLNVERTHNFVANGLVTHNSIYASAPPTSATSSSSRRTSRTRR